MAEKGIKKTKLVALSGIIAAISVVVMLAAYFPWFTYAMPAIAGCFLILLVFEAGKKYALSVFCATGILCLFICEKEAAVSYIAFFGYYPVLKAVIEKIPNRIVEWIVKILLFNLAFGAILVICTYVFMIDAEALGDFGKYTLIITLGCGNVMFITYDIALTQLVTLYVRKYRKKITKLMR